MRAVSTALPVVTHIPAFRAVRAIQRGGDLCTTQLKPVARFMGVLVNGTITRGAVTALAFLGILSCSDSTAADGLNADDLSADPNRVLATIEVHLASDTIEVGQTTTATVTEYDRRGRPLSR